MSDTPDDTHQEPPPSCQLRCSCGYWGEARVRMTHPGCRGSIAGPPEPATFVASCPTCGYDLELDPNMEEGDHATHPDAPTDEDEDDEPDRAGYPDMDSAGGTDELNRAYGEK